MKKLLFFAFVPLMLVGAPQATRSHGHDAQPAHNHAILPAHIHTAQPAAEHTHAAQTAMVYICTGEYATSYHSDRECAAGNCKATVKAITQSEAIRLGRKACGRCMK